jgi:parvulin-like peptidyl-prolyl isomerase
MRACLMLFLLLVTDAGMSLAQTSRMARSQEYWFSVTWFNLAWFNPAQESSLPESGTPQRKTVEDQSQPATSTESSVRPEDAVITLHGVCSSSVGATQEKDESCKTVVSRRDFEFLSNSINLGGKPISTGARQNLAKTYAQYLVYEQPAKNAGLENTERYAEIMRWLRLRMLTDLLREKIVDEFRTPSAAEVARYYQDNVTEFERVHIARIMVPRNAAVLRVEKLEGGKQEQDKKLLAVASEARQRAVKGDDPETIQKDVYSALQIGTVPPTDLGKQARKDFVAAESAELFSLQPGEVSKVETEVASYVIYKVISRETLPESDVKDQISREIARRKIEKANKAITQPVQPVYNDKYFGPPVPEPLPPGKSPHP